MSDAPDFRSDRSESPEGRGIAYGRSAAFWNSRARERAGRGRPEATYRQLHRGLPGLHPRRTSTSTVVEDAELIGFWVAWHKAGGFGGLEAGGWHRATIYRKIRRFRARFGAHPDEHRFEWIKLDLERAWSDELEDFLHPSRPRRTPTERPDASASPHLCPIQSQICV